jgi:SAM-dependent methyltransferase
VQGPAGSPSGLFHFLNAMINADPQELAKFGELAHRWWDPESDFKPLHQINPLRLGWIQQLCPLAGKRVLDVGCGGGILSDSMARAGAQVLGIDLSVKPLRVAELHGACGRAASRLRCRDLHGNARARARPGFRRAGLRDAGEAGWLGVPVDAEPQCQVVLAGHRRCRICAEHASQRHA